MPIYVPGPSNMYESGLDNLIQALLNRNAVVHAGNECIVQAHAVPDMGVRVRDGTVQGAAVRVPVAQTDLAVSANGGANPRVDLVSVNFTTGVPTITAGAAAVTPKPPALPATDILLAYVSVPPAAVNIQAANISDRRLFLPTYEDVLALSAAASTNPNLILNSDFGRRTVFGLAMPEAFADTSGYAIQSGAPTVASNILTFNAANNTIEWPKDQSRSWAWRDGRASATFKAVSATGVYRLRWHFVDSNNWMEANFGRAGNFFEIYKDVASATTSVVSVAQTLTVNRWYWIEIETQGTTVIAKLYDTGGTSSGVTKASSTLLQTLTGTISDAAIQVGPVVITSDQAAAQWGGIATGNGGVYVETWLPESWVFQFNVGAQFGGLAVGFDEAADSGPLTKQWAMRCYVPATSRSLLMQQAPLAPDNMAIPSISYTGSIYLKTAGKGGSGALITALARTMDLAQANVATLAQMDDAGEAAWTRKSQTGVSAATAKLRLAQIYVNLPATATGTAYFSLFQYELGAGVTAWRNAPADDAPIVWRFTKGTPAATSTSASYVDVEPSLLAGNLFLPWDANVVVASNINWLASVGNAAGFKVQVAAATAIENTYATAFTTSFPLSQIAAAVAAAAGKVRVNLQWKIAGGATITLDSANVTPVLTVTAYRGK